MKNKTVIKIILDIALLAVFILLMNPNSISMAFHEIAGITIGIFFLVHKLLNLQWIKSVTKNIFGKKINTLTRVKYILDVLLLLGVYAIIISGLFMSKVIFPHTGDTGFIWKSLHTACSYLSIVLIGAHIGLHWRWITNGFSRMYKLRGESKFRKWALRTAAFMLAVWGGVNVVSDGVFTKIGSIFSYQGIQKVSGEASTTQPGTVQDETSSSAVDNTTTDTDTQDVEDYLSKLTCTGCHKNCSLLNPRCGRGEQQKQTAIEQFEEPAATVSYNEEAVVWKEDGTSHLQIGFTVYTIGSSGAGASEISASSTEDGGITTAARQRAQGDEPGGNGPGGALDKQANSGILGEFATYIPMMGLFGGMGYMLERILSKGKAKQPV